MSYICSETCTAPITAPVATPISPLRRLTQWIALARQRRALGKLTCSQRADIGITKSQAQAEASKPMWDVPNNWRQ